MTEVLVRDRWVPGELAAKLREFNPRSDMGLYVRECLSYLPAEMAVELIERVSRILVIQSALSIKVLRGKYLPRDLRPFVFPADSSHALLQQMLRRQLDPRVVEDLGVVGERVITTAGVNFLVDAWQNSVELENLKYHGIGTGSTAEDVGDTALVTELTTEYNPDNTRATGSLTEGASANIFRTVGTNTLDGTPGAALREHGIFSQAATGGGTLWDRTVYGAITLSSGDGLQTTYDMTASAGG